MKQCSTCSTLYATDLCPKCMAGFAQQPSDPKAPPDDLPLKTGQTFHGLEIMELLGKGGMGVVYKARQPALDRLVALKILPQKMALDPDFQNRFIREAKALGSLNHPNLVAVYDFGAEAGLFFFAMEYVDGTNLRHILRDRNLTAEHALKIVPQLCDALEYAHGEGVVHRDIKPENILIDKKGRVKIADFGLAKLVGADVPAQMLTVTNMVMGTPHYMAPEQVENPKSVDHRADIYAIGVVFYEMLTGELPIGRFEVPSKKVSVDVRLDEVVLKALEKEPNRRYQKASDVKDAVAHATSISAVESYSPTVVTPRPAPPKSSLKWIAIFAAAVLLIVLGVPTTFLLLKKQPDVAVDPKPAVVTPPPAPAAAGPIDLTPLHFGPTERPARYVFSQPDKTIPRNPFPAKDPAEVEILVKALDGIGLQNISHKDVRQGYLCTWWRWSAAFAALETDYAERIEREFLALGMSHKWTHRKGPLVVLAWVPQQDARELFADLVTRLQKKLGLPLDLPDVALENLKLERGDLPSGWGFAEGAPPMPARSNRVDQYQVAMIHPEDEGSLELRVWIGRTVKDAEGFVTEKLGFQDRRKTEIHQVGRVAAGLALQGENFGAFEKTAVELRKRLGLPERTFDTVILNERELPAGFTIAKSLNDPARVLEEIGMTGVRSSEVSRASILTFKPHGQAVLLEVPDSTPRSAIEQHLRKSGPAWYQDRWVFGVEAPSDEALDALENRMREKFGWDRNRPRPIHLIHARIESTDLPDGWTLGPVAAEKQLFSGEIRGAGLVLPFKIQEVNNSNLFEGLRKSWGVKPGDVFLVKDYILAHVAAAGEASWPALDAIEAALRKKMRMDASPAVEELAIRASELPAGSAYLDRGSDRRKNPAYLKHASKDVAGWWQGQVDPSQTLVEFFELRDAAKAAGFAEAQRRGSENAALKPLVFLKGTIVARVEPLAKGADAGLQAIADVVRAKLRLK